MRGPPIRFQVLCHVLASLLQLILVQDHVEHLGRALGELLGGHHLHVQVSDLRLASRLDQPLEHFGRGDLQVDDRRRQTSLGQLRRVIDRVAVQHYQLDYYFKSLIIFFFSGRERERSKGLKKRYLKGSGELEDPLDLGLNLGQTTAPAGGSFHDGSFRWIVE